MLQRLFQPEAIGVARDLDGAELGEMAGLELGVEQLVTAVPQTRDEVDERQLAEVMRIVPWGAGVLAGSAVALLVLGYLVIYLFVLLPRGTVG